MGHGDKVSCVLCLRSQETKITGALSTKDQVTAHQNCLLFSSGIYCRNSPQFDDLFGFSVEDVLKEVKRGGKLKCYKCKRKGATAGCEVTCCKKSYHFPCAVQEGAHVFEDTDNEKYGLYCIKHYEAKQIKDGSVNGRASSFPKRRTSKDSNEAGSSKKGISLERLSNGVFMLYCNKHASPSHKRDTDGESSAAGASVFSDSNSSSGAIRLSSKRRLSYKQHGSRSKRKSNSSERRPSLDSSHSDEKEPNSDLAIFAPLESDLEESANSVPESQLIRKGPTASASGNQLDVESKEKNKNEDETTIDTDAESESLLLPVEICVESFSSVASATQTVSAAHPSAISVKEEVEKREDEGSSPVHSLDQHVAGPSVPPGSPACTSLAISPAPPEVICGTLLSSPPSLSEPSIDSTSFWKSCNVAGCTQSIFTDFVDEMNEISRRIQSDQASQEDYDLALKVMEASGKLAKLVAKQQKDLQRKQMELQKAAAAMKEVVSALKQ